MRIPRAEVFQEKDFLANEKIWQEAVNQLVVKQFITEEVDEDSHELTLVIRKDSYFDRVITDYPISYRPHQLYQDFARLQNVFVSLRDPVALVDLGNTLIELKRDQQALDAYEQAIHLDPTIADVYIGKGIALGDLNRYEEALDAFEQAIRLDPTAVTAYIDKGDVLRYFERYEEALDAYEQAIHLDPTSAHAYNGKGVTLERLGKNKQAQQAFNSAHELGFSGQEP